MTLRALIGIDKELGAGLGTLPRLLATILGAGCGFSIIFTRDLMLFLSSSDKYTGGVFGLIR